MIDDERGTSDEDLDFGALVDPSLARAQRDERDRHMNEEEAAYYRDLAATPGRPRSLANPPLPDSLMRRAFYPPPAPDFEAMRIPAEHLEAARSSWPSALHSHNAQARRFGLHEVEERAPSAPTVDHASYLGASDIGAILGLDPMRTALDVWAEKTRRIVFVSSPEIEAGNDHEEAVVRGFTRRARREGLVERVDYPGPGTIVAGFRGATLDARARLVGERNAVVEAKLVGAGMADAWGPEPAGADGIPLRTLAQVHWQTMHARERFGGTWDVGFVAADIAGTDRRLYQIPIDDRMILELEDAGREWWRAHVVADVMPEPTARDLETLSAIFPHVERFGLSPFPPSGLRELVEDYAAAREITIRHRDELARIGARVRAMLGGAEGYTWRGGRVTWREDAAGARRLHVKIWRTE